MQDFRRKWNAFLYRNRDKGIPNLMLIICIGTLVVYFFQLVDQSNLIYNFMRFDRSLIFQGQVWRLLTYIFIPTSGSLWLFLLLFAYFSIGRILEAVWGTLRFNLFYFCGVLLMDIGALLLGTTASTSYLNLSLFVALATMYPDNKVLLMYIIPLKMKYLAWFYLGMTVYDVVFLHDLSSLIALLNYFIFFGKDCMNVLPGSDRVGSRTIQFSRKQKPNANWASAYQKKPSGSSRASGTSGDKKKVVDEPAYRHKCTICGRTDVSNPELEFRYCSKCSGFYCYCQDHINNHVHIQ